MGRPFYLFIYLFVYCTRVVRSCVESVISKVCEGEIYGEMSDETSHRLTRSGEFLREKADTDTRTQDALSHVTRDNLQQCSVEFRPGPEPLGRQDMRRGR